MKQRLTLLFLLRPLVFLLIAAASATAKPYDADGWSDCMAMCKGDVDCQASCDTYYDSSDYYETGSGMDYTGSGDYYETGSIGPFELSPELADIVGKKEASRAELMRLLWAYIKKNNLQVRHRLKT